MASEKALTLLGFASKAGKLCYGFEASVNAMKSGKSFLAVCSGELSSKSSKEVRFFGDRFNVPVVTLDGTDIQTLSDAVGRKCGVISVNDRGFADAVKAAMIGGNADDK